jgi:hypothetical protein
MVCGQVATFYGITDGNPSAFIPVYRFSRNLWIDNIKDVFSRQVTKWVGLAEKM